MKPRAIMIPGITIQENRTKARPGYLTQNLAASPSGNERVISQCPSIKIKGILKDLHAQAKISVSRLVLISCTWGVCSQSYETLNNLE